MFGLTARIRSIDTIRESIHQRLMEEVNDDNLNIKIKEIINLSVDENAILEIMNQLNEFILILSKKVSKSLNKEAKIALNAIQENNNIQLPEYIKMLVSDIAAKITEQQEKS